MSRKTIKLSALFASLTLAAAIAGCGTSNKEGTISLDSVAKVDEALCAQCHGAAIETLTGDEIYDKYMASRHNQNFVGCQDCHGGGAQHNGIGPIPFPKPGNAQCDNCHETTVAQFEAASHGPTDFTLEYAEDEAHRKCSRCHTHQGAIVSNISGYTGDSDFLTANADAAPGLDEDGSRSEGMKCVTCHVTHETEELRTVNTISAGAVVPFQPTATVGGAPSANEQFILCTSCHNYTTPAGELVASGTAPTKKYYHNTAWYRIIATTHYDNPATPAVIEGYVLRTTGTNNSDPCFDCHGHNAKTGTRPGRPASIHTDWAKSAHGGKILTAKIDAAAGQTDRTVAEVDAVMAAGSIDDPDATNGAPGWVHYDWDSVGRASCQRCHTASGLVNFLTSPTAYNSANNNFGHLQAGQNEVLYCWSCHTDAGDGTLRDPGAITETYSAGTAGDPATTVAYPNVAGSNVCMSCHLGRETGEVIKNDQDADGVRSFINSHYLAAGGTLFGTTGYEFTGKDYTNPSFFAHDKIGSTDAAGTGSNGPCVGCHMTTPNSHGFTNVTKNDVGAITAITSTACVTCHSGNNALTPEALTVEEEEYIAALEALNATLASKGIFFHNAHPYFYNGAGGTGGAFTNWAGVYGLAEWRNTMGAAFNFNLLEHDPGGYAHNRFYAKRLIWDSIDYIYDGTLDDDVVEAIDAQVTAARLDAAVAAEAKTYLGTSRR